MTFLGRGIERAMIIAFVSDVARGLALFQQGGIYLDTDVEVLKSFDPLLHHRSFWGFEAGNFVATSTIGAVKGHEWVRFEKVGAWVVGRRKKEYKCPKVDWADKPKPLPGPEHYEGKTWPPGFARSRNIFGGTGA